MKTKTKSKPRLKEKIINVLKNIPDPELGVPIWDLGLIYNVKVKDDRVEILMTLTSVGCPLYTMIEEEIKREIKKIPQVKEVLINLTFDPPWNIDRISKEARKKLGF